MAYADSRRLNARGWARVAGAGARAPAPATRGLEANGALFDALEFAINGC